MLTGSTLELDRQACEFLPRTRRESLAWYWGCGDYTLAEALALRPLVLAPAQIRRCLRVRGRRPDSDDEFVLDFTQQHHNRIIAARLPAGFPHRLIEDGRGADYLRALLREQLAVLPRGLTFFWFVAALLSLLALQTAAPELASALARRAASPDCAGACPMIVAHACLIGVTGLIPLALGVLLPPLRYAWLMRRDRVSAVLRATVRTELLLLTGVNLLLIAGLVWRLTSGPLGALLRGLLAR